MNRIALRSSALGSALRLSQLLLLAGFVGVIMLASASTSQTPGGEAATFTTLLSFDGTNGGYPVAPLVQGFDGSLYGASDNVTGAIFTLTPKARTALKTIYYFCTKTNCPDGASPVAGLVRGFDRNFYGMTYGGGTFNAGTIFKITPQGTLTTLYSFGTQATDGFAPTGSLVQATDGNFYGVTYLGGSNDDGTVFKITPQGVLTTLHTFSNSEGYGPESGLVQASDGELYGTTFYGGSNYQGTIFRITLQGVLTTLYSFCGKTNCEDGANPSTALIQATNGNLYGTTLYGGYGGVNGYGTAFKITTQGTLTTLHKFCAQANCTDGRNPISALVQATDGNFYGTAGGGQTNRGVAFRITPHGALTALHSFCSQANCTDGDASQGLMQSTDGSFCGTTFVGGTHDRGTVFKLSVGLRPFVETLPSSGKMGAKIDILGTSLKSATSVTFNGVEATMLTIVSDTHLTAVVPTGVTKGPVVVTTPSGTLKSTKKFTVLK